MEALNNMNNLRTAVIGIGNMGLAHAACIADNQIIGMSLEAVCDINEDKLLSFSKNYPNVKIYTSYLQLFKDGICDSIVIAVPHPLHAEIAILAFEYGLNVLLEKPADISVSKVKKLNETAIKSGNIFAIMFNQRTNPLFSKAKEIVKNGELGELKRTVWTVTNWFRSQHYYDSGDWRATWLGEGGGVLLNQAPHNLDLWQWICGMPSEITAYCDSGKYHNIEVEDDVTIFARYKNGATGVFITSTGEYPGTNRFEISGNLGKIVLENQTLKWFKLKEPVNTVIENSNKEFTQIDYDYFEIMQDAPETAHKGILQNFVNAILYGEELIAPGIEGINELVLSNAAYMSEWLDNKKIILPFDDILFDKMLLKKMDSSKYRKIHKIGNGNMDYSSRWKVQW